MTAIIRATAAHDFLALVPVLAGFVPERSLVCVAFSGNRSVGVLRHDLPPEATDHERLVTAVIGTICRIPDVDAVVPVVYSSECYGESGGMPHRDLLELVVERAGRAGFHVRDALCQAADAWSSLLDPESPATGHPLDLVASSPVLLDVPESDRPGSSQPRGGLPDADPAIALQVAGILEEFADLRRVERAVAGLARDADPVELVETLVARPRRRPLDARRVAWLLHLAARPPYRDAMMLQMAFGRTLGEIALDLPDPGSEPIALVGDRVERRADERDDVLANLMLGRSMLRPDSARAERGIEQLRRAVAHAPEDVRPGPLCMAAWLAWSLGRGSEAGGFLDAALAIAPEHSMAGLLEGFIGAGALPEWAFARRAAADEVHGFAVGGL
ncbi:DUF4192 family protein [Agromyces sp. NPDC058110]|uniref:DUF4192 family protein n=1 Tax=Agromyces sp. NPDC058110 TaxID=3346345 RepID=UPI0036D9FDC0